MIFSFLVTSVLLVAAPLEGWAFQAQSAALPSQLRVSTNIPIKHAQTLVSQQQRFNPSAPKNVRFSTTLIQASVALEDSDEGTKTNYEAIGKGVLRDYKMRLKYWKSDITDGLNIQCVAATMFLFFACLAPAVGFGTLYDKATAGAIGTVEMLSSTAACGVLYAMFSAQPVTIIASTGPVLAFVASLAQLADVMSLPFLPLYGWTGLWTAGILLLSSLTSASNMVKYLTQFTDEIFSLLISAIFLINGVGDIGKTFASSSSTFTKSLLTLVTAMTTFLVSRILKKTRETVYFNKTVRKTVSSFAPTIGVMAGAFVARWARITQGASLAGLPTLTMPNIFGTTTGRPWLVPLFDLPVWARWAAFLPAIMASILLFFDQNITVRLVNNPKNKMVKGRRHHNMIDGMHGDMLVIAILTAIQSVLGIPWLIASTVHSVAHVQALSNTDRQGQIESLTEQRLTGIAIHGLIGCCILFASPRKLLAQLSLPVFTGLFMYLGVTGLAGNEMWTRLSGLVKDKEVAPKQRWTDTVPTNVVNRYTAIQMLCLALMYGVKESKTIGVLFPVIIAALAPIRIGIEKFGLFKKEDLEILDEE